MGLDVTAYSRVVLLEVIEDVDAWETKYYDADDPDRMTYVYDDPDFRDRLPPIVADGAYRIDGEVIDFRAGSYGGYNEWRNQLARLALGVEADQVWADPDAYVGKPFYELIDFSDCEGVIGTDACTRLAADFAAFQDRVDTHTHADDWFREKYRQWHAAFALAADGGFVSFH